MRGKKVILFFLLGIFLSIMHSGFVYAEKRITSEFDGGDCTSIGTWDESNLTCSLTMDIVESIVIGSDGITLDGAEHIINGTGVGGYGIYLDSKTGVTIKDVEVKNFTAGIYLLRSNNNSLTNIIAKYNVNGIELFESNFNLIDYNDTSENSGFGILIGKESTENTVTNNYAQNNSASGIQISYSNENIIRDNIILGNLISSGISLTGESDYNEVVYNEVENNRFAIVLRYSDFNQIYNNNFIDNDTPALITDSNNNQFNLSKPIGGNYWSGWLSPDDDGDGFVDVPLSFSGGTDDFPWALPNGWLFIDNTPPQIIISSPEPKEYSHSHILNIDFSALDSSGLDEQPTATLDDLIVPNDFSINLLTMKLGIHKLIVNACDTMGNCAEASVSFHIIANLDSLVDTVNYFAEQSMIYGNFPKTLLKKLEEAEKGIENGVVHVAINKLNDFIKQINIQIEKHISEEAGIFLVTDAQYVLNQLQN